MLRIPHYLLAKPMCMEIDFNAAPQAALRLTNRQREEVIAAYGVLSAQLNTANQDYGGATEKPTNGSAPVGGGANLVGYMPRRSFHLLRPCMHAARDMQAT